MSTIARSPLLFRHPFHSPLHSLTSFLPPPPYTSSLLYRIVGGSIVPLTPRPRYPYLVSFRTSSDSHFCGGSLIAPSVILTAAHCLDQTDSSLRYPTVNLGRYYRTSAILPYTVSRCKYTIIHPEWNLTFPSQGDISLCILPQPFPQYETLRLSSRSPPSNTSFTTIGWGTTSQNGQLSEALQEVNVSNWDLKSCNASYGGVITEGMICAGDPAGGKDACQGDSGGPLIIRGNSSAEDLEAGIVSFGEGCAQVGFPGVYTSVPVLLPWILRQLDALNLTSTLKQPYGLNASLGSIPPSNSNSSSAPKQDVVCSCTSSGLSGGAQTNIIGCYSGSASSPFCYVQGGAGCIGATASSIYSGAYWLPCTATTTPALSPTTTTTRPGLALWGLFAQGVASVLGR